MATFLVAHGAWSAGWAWKKMRQLLRGVGHEIWTPTHTGLGERAHLASPTIDLETHIDDILAVIETEDLRDLVLIGHSYGGMVATGVAARAGERIAKLVYLDAFAPRDSERVFDLLPAEHQARMREGARLNGDGWRIPPNPMPPDTPEADVAWAVPRRKPQPLKTFDTPIRIATALPPRSYIYCKRSGPGDVFRQFADRARAEGWPCFEMDASHNPHITAPEALRDILLSIATKHEP